MSRWRHWLVTYCFMVEGVQVSPWQIRVKAMSRAHAERRFRRDYSAKATILSIAEEAAA